MKKILTFAICALAMFLSAQSLSALTYTVTVPKGTNGCFIAGSMNGWSPRKMTKVDDTHYTIEYPEATEETQYKYLSGPAWDYEELTAEGEKLPKNRQWSENDIVAKWKKVFEFDERDVTIEVFVPLAVKELYIIGTFYINNVYIGWISPTPAQKMTFVSENSDGKIYKITVHSDDAMNMQFKFAAGPAWAYEQTDKSNFKYDTKENLVSVVVDEFKAYFDPAKTGTINIKATVPKGTEATWMVGDFIGWDMKKAIKGELAEDGTFLFSIPLVMSIEYRLYNKPDWGYAEIGEADPTKDLPNRKAVYPADANTAITVWNWKKNTSVKDIVVEHFKLYSKDRQIVVDGVQKSIQIYDMTGRNIQSKLVKGTYTSPTLNSGIYVIRVDNISKKVILY